MNNDLLDDLVAWYSDQRVKINMDYVAEKTLIRNTVCDHWRRRLKLENAYDKREMKFSVIEMEYDLKLATMQALWACEHEPAYETNGGE